MNHFVVYPSADPERGVQCANAWMAKGYCVVMMLDRGGYFHSESLKIPKDVIFHAYTSAMDPFAGYYQEINSIVYTAFKKGADLVTCVGDDMLPPEQGVVQHTGRYLDKFPDGFGVMQCIGDKQGEAFTDPVTKTMQHNAGRVCGSPTFGRGWYERAYGGVGPFSTAYGSFYGDEDLQNVAHMLGVLYQEPALTIEHLHWAFGRTKREWWHEKAQSKHWTQDKETFFRRKGEGFPGHKPKALAKELR